MVLLLMTVPGFLVWRELEPLLLFRPVQGVCVWAEQRPVTMRMANRRGRLRKRSGFIPEATFRYRVDGVEYVSSTFARMPRMESAWKVRRRMNGVLTGVGVKAWYNPFDPSEAVIDRSPNLIWLWVLAVVGVFGAIVWMVADVEERKHRAAVRQESRPDLAA